MSGLYLIGVIAIWAWLSYFLWKVWRNARGGNDGRVRIVINVLGIVFGLFWFGASAYYAGGRALLGNLEVDRLCKQDGGLRVYETVTLPAKKFDNYGVVRIPSKQDAKPQDEYYYEQISNYHRDGNPKITRTQHRIVRRSDGRVLGESVRYSRGGGWLPGPWHGSSYMCPSISKDVPAIEESIFIEGE